jgi:hypothetical protein
MKFLCLAYEEERLLANLSRSEWDALRSETLTYVDRMKTSGHLLDARPLQSATTASTVRVRNGRAVITDGPFAETKEQLGGYFLVEARDLDEAISLVSGWPSARFGTIEVRPVEDGLSPAGRYPSREPASARD